MTPAELLSTKIQRGFDHLDADRDGWLDEDDHVLMGRRIAESLGHAPGSPEEQRIIDMYLRIWREVHLPHVEPGAPGISRDSFVTSTSALADDPAAAQATLGALAEAFLEIADLDADGTVTFREFLAYQHGHFPGMTETAAQTAFTHLDTDGDGHLSPEEFIRATIEYWTSSDPASPGNWWLGDPVAQ
ncbi:MULTISPECIES: EF-hand domain-containing protein [Actinokineospora]|uniref:Calcium-binding protein n=1 Tax=Actinokineospora fastidiosa TaxID=1816 RepID=A0A918LJ01_9PSEU|nr:MULTISPECIES: EF-hand domain-containing protein [Actinokineospora]UVS79160.1 Calcium-binding protein [Actinokineospora sp. UTMC 2448]GGS58353.1 calcium-binding protein [Actinokineospora fastidiosa]